MLSTTSIFLSALCTSFSVANFIYSTDRKHPDKDWIRSCSNGINQSPININESDVSSNNKRNTIFKNYDKYLSANVINDGHTVHLRINDFKDTKILVDDEKEYQLYTIHFHWGCSEHTLNNKSYALELHLVHNNTKIGQFDRVFQGASVVAVLFEKSDIDNEALNTILDIIRRNTTKIENKIKYEDLLPKTPSYAYQYFGSFTTPPCSESVLWNVIAQTNYISPHQIQKFQTLNPNLPEFNCRTIKNLNNRKINYSKIKKLESSSSAILYQSIAFNVVFDFFAVLIIQHLLT